VHEIAPGYVLVDGAQVGLGRLLERIEDGDVTEETWPYSPALRTAAALSVPFRFDAKQIRPYDRKRLDHRWLSSWHDPGTVDPVRWNPLTTLPARAAGAPRLCVALLVRGIAAAPLLSFVRYHHAIGFERVTLCFDRPDEPAEEGAVDALLDHAAGLGGASGAELQVHLCTPTWWAEEKRHSRFYQRRDHADNIYRDVVDLHENIRDVQARQSLAIERAIRDAHADGFDWLLHIDSDELLLLPQHRDARHFFASVAPEYQQVVFNNCEAVPERFDVGDWFREVSLFKVHQNLLHEDPTEVLDTSEQGQRRRERKERWRQRKIKNGADPDDFRDNRTFDTLMLGTRLIRRDSSFDFDFDLPEAESDPEKPSESEDEKKSSKSKWRSDVPSYFTAYGNGKAACRLQRGAPPPLPVGVHRCASDSNTMLRNLKCSGSAAPVVLHYANCGYEAWKQKYKILSAGHGTPDGSFSLTRKGINSMRAHLAHHDLLRRGTPEQLEAYFRTFIMCGEFGELAHWACHGLLVRTHAIRELLDSVSAAPNRMIGNHDRR